MLYPCSRNFSLVMIPDLIRSHGHGQSLWTNWRWTNFLVSYQLPLRSKGRPWYRCNLKLIHTGLCEPRVVNTVASIAFSNSFTTCHSLDGRCRFVVPTLPRVMHWMDSVASLSPLWALYIYIGAFSLLSLTSLKISYLPTCPRSSSSFLLSFQVFLLPS